jgi:hypothetical protein
MIKTIDRMACRVIRDEVDTALKAIGDRHGIVVKSLGGGTFSPERFTFKVEAAVVGEGGEVLSKEADEFRTCANMYGMKGEDLGKVFTVHGTDYRIRGMKMRSFKFPIMAERVSDKRGFKFPLSTVKAALGYKVTAQDIVG